MPYSILSRMTRRTNAPVAVALLLLVVLLVLPTGYEGALTYQNADRVRAEVLDTDESSIVDTGLVRTGEQRCTVELLGGHFEGQTATAVNRLSGSLAQDKLFAPGDIAFVTVSYGPEGITAVSMWIPSSLCGRCWCPVCCGGGTRCGWALGWCWC